MSSAQTRHHPGPSPFESRNIPERVQMTRSQILLELEGSAPSTLPETPKNSERVTEHPILIDGLANAQVRTPSLLGETREEQRVYNPVVSIHAKDEDVYSPETVSTAPVLPDSVPISSPIPIAPATPKTCPSTPSFNHSSSRAIREVRRPRDSTSESPMPSERVRMTRSQTHPSSLKPDFLFMPRELQRNSRSSLMDHELSKARKTDFHGKSPSESSTETAATVSRTSSKYPTHVEKRQLSEPTVLVQKLSDKSTGTVKSSPRSRVVTVATPCAPSSGAASNSKSRMENATVSTGKQANMSEYAPSTKTALTLSKLSPVSPLRAHPPNRLMNEPKPSPLNVSKRHAPGIVSTKQMASRSAHQKVDARSRASLPAANRPFGKPPSSPGLGQSDQLKRAARPLGSSFKLPANIPERSAEHSILSGRLTNKQVVSLSPSGGMGEERRTLDAVISKQKENIENPIPEASAASTLPVSTPITIPIHPGPSQCSSLEEIHTQVTEGAIQRVSTPETRNTLERAQMTRSEASPSSAESDSHPETPGLIMSPPNIAREPMVADAATGEAKKSVKPKGGPTQSSGICERSAERSAQIQRLVGARASTLSFSDERREKQRIYDNVVNIQINTSEEKDSLEATAASTLPFSTSVPSYIRPAPTAFTRPSSDEHSPPVEVVTGRRILSVVNKTLLASEQPHSPYNGTARRQSQYRTTPSRDEGVQLARAAAYIRERISRRSLACDESIRCSPKVPPDKTVEPRPDSRWLAIQVINKEMEASVTIRSPEPEGPEAPLIQPDAAIQQPKTWRANELSSGHSEASPRLPGPTLDEADNRQHRDLHAVNNVEMSMSSRSLVPNTALTPFRSSASACPTQIYPSFQPSYVLLEPHRLVHPLTQSSAELDWLYTSRQCPWDVVNTSINSENTIRYLLESKAESNEPSPILSKTGRTRESGPSFPQDVPYQSGTGEEAQQRSLCTISNVKTGTTGYSPDYPAVPLPRSRIPVDSLPVFPSVWLNIKQLQPIPSELPVSGLGSSQRCPFDVVNTKFNSSTSLYSPQPAAVYTLHIPERTSQAVSFDLDCSLGISLRTTRVLSVITFCETRHCEAEETEYTIIHEYIEDDEAPASTPPSYAYVDVKATVNALPSLPPEPSWWAETPGSVCVERVWRARCKPPSFAVNLRRQNYPVVNKTINMGKDNSPLYRAVRILPKPFNSICINRLRPRRQLYVDIFQFTSNPARLLRHCHSLISLVVAFLQYLRIDSEG
ncbi:hypothetical protein F5887DRAFT_1260326 [Amanita rubescens]|nr:hypothetical protein F5887DRAFT_1260326 [Amanita rubescens]